MFVSGVPPCGFTRLCHRRAPTISSGYSSATWTAPHTPPTCLLCNQRPAPLDTGPACPPLHTAVSDTVRRQPHRHHLEQRVPREHETQLKVNMGRHSRRSPYHPDVSASRVSARATRRGLPRTALRAENRAQLLCRQRLPNTRAGLKAGDVRTPEAGAQGPGRQSPERGRARLVGA